MLEGCVPLDDAMDPPHELNRTVHVLRTEDPTLAFLPI